MTNKQPDIEEQIKEILKPVDDIIITQAARGYPYTGGNLVLAILNLVAQREQQARIDELGELLEFISYDEGFEPTRQLLHDRLAELKEDKELEQNNGGNKGEWYEGISAAYIRNTRRLLGKPSGCKRGCEIFRRLDG